MIRAEVIMGDTAILWTAERRAKTNLDNDSRAELRCMLTRRANAQERPEICEIARWALDHEDAAGLRERWARELATAAAEATAVVWRKGLSVGWRNIINQTVEDGRSWLVHTVLSSPVLTDAIRSEVWETLGQDTVGPLWWLGGYVEQEIPDENVVPDGFDIVDYRITSNEAGVTFRLLIPDSYLSTLDPSLSPDDPNGIVDFIQRDLARYLPPNQEKPKPVTKRVCVIRPSEPPRYLRAFARALWQARWYNEAAERFRRTSRTLALTTRTTNTVVAILSPATTVQRREGEINLVSGGRSVGLVRDDDLLAMLTTWQGPLVDTGIARASASRIVENGRTAAGIAGFYHALKTVTALYREDKDLRAEWPSWLAWAEEVADHAEQRLTPHLRSLLYDFAWYGNSVQLRLWDDRWARGLWTLTAPDPYKRGRPSAGSSRGVAFRYADILDPGWARRENPTDRGRGVHLLALPERLTSYVRDPSQKGPAQLYSLLILAEVCDQSKHDQVDDGATISPIHRRMLTEQAGLHRDQEPIQLRGLLDHGLLVEVGPDRFALGMPEAKKMRAYVRPQPRRNTKKQ